MKRSQSSSSSLSRDTSTFSSESIDYSSIDPVIAKRERRKQQNRAAAATSRHKKQKLMAEMETRISQLMSEQAQLIADVQSLQQQNQVLRDKVQQKTVKVKHEEAGEEEGVEVEEAEHVSSDHVSLPSSPSSPTSSVDEDDEVREGNNVDGLIEDFSVSGVFYESAALASPQWKTPNTEESLINPLMIPSLLILSSLIPLTLSLLHFSSMMTIQPTLSISLPINMRTSTASLKQMTYGQTIALPNFHSSHCILLPCR